MASLRQLFFSPDGRITRRQFWLGHAMILGATVVLSLVGGFVVGILSTLPGFEFLRTWGPVMIGGVVAVLALIAELTLAVKRMHDRDASGLWVIGVVIVALLANLAIGGQHVLAGESPLTPLTAGLTVFTMIMGGWLIVELGFMRGTEGENAYGGEPAVSVKVQGGENTPMLSGTLLARKANAG